MFVLLASQRPSELSKTVLSQCSNFLVHRIQNPDDLSQICQMTPFISELVLKRLPSLPRQHALVFGTSVNLPTTFKVREASPRPRSDDTAVVDLWFHEEGRAADIRLTLRTAEAAWRLEENRWRKTKRRTMTSDHLEAMAQTLEATGDYRVLRRLKPRPPLRRLLACRCGLVCWWMWRPRGSIPNETRSSNLL